MKNKRAIKYTLRPIIQMIISGCLAFVVLMVLQTIIRYLYYYTKLDIINVIVALWNSLDNGQNFIYPKEIAKIMMFMGLTLGIYIKLTYKYNKDLVNVLESAEKMAEGNLENRIEVTSMDDMGKLANNINNIADKLRNITVEERRAQQTKTDLITNVSHDLRTPLTSIMGYLGLIENDQYKDEVQLRYYITIAYEKSKSLNVLINDLFELTKMQNSTLKLDKVNIDLVELLGQVVTQFQHQFSNVEMEGRTFFSEDKLIVNADPNKLVRAFENLITNGMKYGKYGHYVDVKTKTEEGYALVQFINYGDEISSLDIPYIFERFYRTDKSRNSENGGSGLGLAITKNIIELHDGSIEVSSDAERTIFEVRLPLIK